MRAFTFSLFARHPDGSLHPLTGAVGAPVAANDGTNDYLCSFACPLTKGGGQTRSPLPEWAYSKAVSFLRFSIDLTGMAICDASGADADIAVPVTDEFGIPCFPAARFHGSAIRDGRLVDFTAEVQPPELRHDGLWGCAIKSIDFDLPGPILSSWPEHAYELAFDFIRRMIGYRSEGQSVDRSGKPLLIRAPVRPPRRH
jgi:hypothetical protein